MPEDIDIGRQWIAKAENDLLNADNNLVAEEIPFDTVCFHCQQAAEKLLKGYLAANGQSPPLTHDLLLLLEKIIDLDDSVESLREHLAILTPYAVEVRYPDDGFMPLEEDAIEARTLADEVFTWLRKALPALVEEQGDSEEEDS